MTVPLSTTIMESTTVNNDVTNDGKKKINSITIPFPASVPFDSTERIAYWTGARVRSTFIDYFCGGNGHVFVPSSSTVPLDDPTLLFANSGMTQFKPIFQGVIDPAAPFAKLRRAANSQKCIRAGGKHNDLEDVGKDVYHHTFFEMLGNWSFGDYFKREAIEMAYRLLTEVFAMPKERLYVTFFAGNEKLGLPRDDEAAQIWAEMGIPEDHILPFGMKENFWEMGEQGPCGPCSEIHFDRIGGGRDASSMVNADDPDVLEIWNLVFMQYNREADGSLRPLPSKHVDTGAGLERITSVLQCKRSNYDTDLFAPLFAAIHAGCPESVGPYKGRVGKEQDLDGVDMAYRVVADHIRTLTFAISDGGIPSNEGRGYVLRRILRRAIRYSHEKLHAPPGFFPTLSATVIKEFGDAFPELTRASNLVLKVLTEEEVAFRRTLERGLLQFNRFISETSNGHSNKNVLLGGEAAWRLYDTYGFPLDLTKLLAEERGMSVDEAGYAMCQAEARQLSRNSNSASAMDDPHATVRIDVHVADELEKKHKVPPTDDSPKYDREQAVMKEAAKILAFVYQGSVHTALNLNSNGGKNAVDGESLLSVKADEPFGIVLDRTNFYAEEGGQQADRGTLTLQLHNREEVTFDVVTVQVARGYVLHIGHLRQSDNTMRFEGGSLVSGSVILAAAYDQQRRAGLRRNHTATHALNHALKTVLCGQDEGSNSSNLDQRGSLVAPDRLRFDFAFNGTLGGDHLQAVSDRVNNVIAKNWPVSTAIVPLSQAKEISALRAVFGETYPDPVRLVAILPSTKVDEKDRITLDDILTAPKDSRWHQYSIELCGGTHVASSGDMGSFVIVQEGAIAKGIRRIVALTGPAAEESQHRLQELTEQIKAFARSVKANSATSLAQVESHESNLRDLTKDLDEAAVDAVAKANLRDALAEVRRSLTDSAKSLKTAIAKQAVDHIQALLSNLKTSQKSEIQKGVVLVTELDKGLGDNQKALLAAVQAAIKCGCRIALVYAQDHVSRRLIYQAMTQNTNPNETSISAVLVAKTFGDAYVDAVKELLPQGASAKCGGSQDVSQGSAPLPPFSSNDDNATIAEAFQKAGNAVRSLA